MRIYAIDAHLLLREKKDGVPRYAECLLNAMMAIPLESDERVVLYGHRQKPASLVLPEGWLWKVLRWPLHRGWTHGRMSLEMMIAPPSVLFVPGHEVPLYVSPRTAVVTTVHDIAFATVPDVYQRSAQQRQRRAVRRALRSAAMILVPSHAVHHDLVTVEHADPARIVVTPLAPTLPVIFEDHADVLHALRVQKNQYIFAMSRLEKKKNTILLLRAFAALKRKGRKDDSLTLVLAGSFGYGEAEIRRVIAEEQIADDVRLLGYVSDHDASLLLRCALCFAFPSRAEGFGIPILEAMEHGVPVVASAIPSSREVAGDAALFFAQNNSAECAQVIASLRDNSVLRERYITAGYERVKQFSWQRCAEQTLAVLRAAIRESSNAMR